MNDQIKSIISQLEEIHHGRPWMGPTFDYLLASVTAENAFLTPVEGMKCIAEQLSHITFWRKEITYRIEHGQTRTGDDDPLNWCDLDVLRAKGWHQIKAEHDASLSALIAILQTQSNTLLSETYTDADFKGEFEYQWMLQGIVQHDIYHLGQIGVVVHYLKQMK